MPAIGQISAGMRGRSGDETTDRYSAMTSYRPDSLAGARPAPGNSRTSAMPLGQGDRATDSGTDGWGAPRAMTFSGPPEREERVCQARKQGRTADGSAIFRLHGQDGSRISSRGEILDPLARERRQAKRGTPAGGMSERFVRASIAQRRASSVLPNSTRCPRRTAYIGEFDDGPTATGRLPESPIRAFPVQEALLDASKVPPEPA